MCVINIKLGTKHFNTFSLPALAKGCSVIDWWTWLSSISYVLAVGDRNTATHVHNSSIVVGMWTSL